MKACLAAFISGLIFGIGLIISRMVDPAVVMAFLDVTGEWNPSLGLVMATALLIVSLGYTIVLKKPKPLFDDKFRLPSRQYIDAPLLIGAAIFGIGWGLSGLCPGPAIAGLTLLKLDGLLFIIPMVLSMFVIRAFQKRQAS